MDRWDRSKINTKDWTMGNYPMPERRKINSLPDVIAELRDFKLNESADWLEVNLMDYCLELAHTDWGVGVCGVELNGAKVCPEDAFHVSPKGNIK